MAVIQCRSCGSRLQRPEELHGRSWQCPVCGFTAAFEEARAVSTEPATALEQQFQRGSSMPPAVAMPTPAGRPPFVPRKIKADPHGSPRGMVLIICAALVVIAGLFGSGAFTSMTLQEYYPRLFLGVAFALPLLSLLLVGPFLIVMALYRRRVIKTVDARLRAASTRPGSRPAAPARQTTASPPPLTRRQRRAKNRRELWVFTYVGMLIGFAVAFPLVLSVSGALEPGTGSATPRFLGRGGFVMAYLATGAFLGAVTGAGLAALIARHRKDRSPEESDEL